MNSKTLNYKKKYYIIQVNNKKYKIKYQHTKYSLLKVLQVNNINMLYQCKEGYCGICRITLINGQIKYFKKIIAPLNIGDILPCSCILNSNIEIVI